MKPGGADFFQTFAGARALARGENPYQNTLPGMADPWGRALSIEGEPFKVAYPPSQLLFYVPLAKLQDDPRQAGRILFWSNLVLLLGLSLLTRWLLLEATVTDVLERRFSWLLVPLLYFILTANVGTCLGLERGQSDIMGAMLCWGAVALFLKGGRFLPAFLVACAILMKGYALLLGLGLGLLGLPRRGWRPMLAGAAVAAAVLLLPVIGYLDEGLRAARWLSQEFAWPYWNNHGFKNLAYQIAPDGAEPGRIVMTAIALLVTVGCWRLARNARRRDEERSATLWVLLFAMSSLATLVGYGAASFVYNQVLILPGAFVLLLRSDAFAEECRLPPAARRGLPVLLVLTTFLLFTFRLGSVTFGGGPGPRSADPALRNRRALSRAQPAALTGLDRRGSRTPSMATAMLR
jgi:hypothetical protein